MTTSVKEIWKDVVGYEGLYEVSNLGRVRSLDRVLIYKSGKHKPHKGRIMRLTLTSKGYPSVDLCKDGQVKKMLVHRLVAIAFLSNPNNYNVVNHKDETPSNNFADNLECTHQYNSTYGTCVIRRANTHRGMKHKFSHHDKQWKKVSKCDNEMNIITTYDSITIASKETGNAIQGISLASKHSGKRKCGGYYWKYYD